MVLKRGPKNNVRIRRPIHFSHKNRLTEVFPILLAYWIESIISLRPYPPRKWPRFMGFRFILIHFHGSTMGNDGLSCFSKGVWVKWSPLNLSRLLDHLHDHHGAISTNKMSEIRTLWSFFMTPRWVTLVYRVFKGVRVRWSPLNLPRPLVHLHDHYGAVRARNIKNTNFIFQMSEIWRI